MTVFIARTASQTSRLSAPEEGAAVISRARIFEAVPSGTCSGENLRYGCTTGKSPADSVQIEEGRGFGVISGTGKIYMILQVLPWRCCSLAQSLNQCHWISTPMVARLINVLVFAFA